MKDFRTYLAEARTIITEDMQIRSELVAFFEENHIQYDADLVHFGRDLVIHMEGTDWKEKLSKVKEIFVILKDKARDLLDKYGRPIITFIRKIGSKALELLKNPKLQAVFFIALALYLLSQGNESGAKEVAQICSSVCDVKGVSPELLAKQTSAVLDTFKDTLGDDKMEAFKELFSGGKTVLKNAVDLIASKDFSGIKNLGAALSLGTAAKKAMGPAKK